MKGLDLDFKAVPASIIWTSLAINILGLALPLVALQIYDRIIPNEATATLAILVLGLGIAVLVDTVMKVARTYLLGWEAAKAGCAIQIDATRRILAAPLDEIEAERPTTWMDRLDALAEINAASSIPARIVLIDILFVPVYLALFFMVGGFLILAPLLVITPFLFVIVRRGKVLRQSLTARAEQDQRKQDFLVEGLNSILVIKSMAMEPLIQRRYERLQRHSAELNYEIISLSQSLQSLGTLTSALSTVAVVSTGALLIIGGSNLSVGALACCSLLSGRLMQPLMKGVGVWSEHQSRTVSRKRAAPLAAVTGRRQHSGKDPTQCKGGICFNNVSYTAPNQTQPALRNISIDITPGQTVSFRPKDNAAKSVFLDLIRGQIFATEGSVAIDGRSTKTSWGHELDTQIAMVSNRSDVFSGSILENLTMFGGPKEIERARHYARAIGLEDAINTLPEGYDTRIGDAIVAQLPNGLIQQISIVRALTREPAILIFDEAYTSLDSNTDPLVVRELSHIKGRQTLIIAAHRPCYMSLADSWFEFSDGQLTQHDNAGRDRWKQSPPSSSTAAEKIA